MADSSDPAATIALAALVIAILGAAALGAIGACLINGYRQRRQEQQTAARRAAGRQGPECESTFLTVAEEGVFAAIAAAGSDWAAQVEQAEQKAKRPGDRA